MLLLEFDRFELIKLLLRNRLVVIWATKLSRAETDEERAAVEQQVGGRCSTGALCCAVLCCAVHALRAPGGPCQAQVLPCGNVLLHGHTHRRAAAAVAVASCMCCAHYSATRCCHADAPDAS